MNVEVAAIGEKKVEEGEEESCTECEIVELGKVSEDTLGDHYGGIHDPGFGRWFF